MPAQINIEVIWALPDAQYRRYLQVPQGCTAQEAVQLSGLLQEFAGIASEGMGVGIFGQRIKVPASHILKEGDRVEIYRPLTMDPKEIRRARAARVKAKKTAAR